MILRLVKKSTLSSPVNVHELPPFQIRTMCLFMICRTSDGDRVSMMEGNQVHQEFTLLHFCPSVAVRPIFIALLKAFPSAEFAQPCARG